MCVKKQGDGSGVKSTFKTDDDERNWMCVKRQDDGSGLKSIFKTDDDERN